VSETRRQAPEITPVMAAAAAAVGAPDFILPWLDRFYDEDDAELLLAAAAGEGRASLVDAGEGRLARAVRRGVLDRDEAGNYAPATLHVRLEIWAMFEGWKDVPPAAHRQLAEWDVDYYAESIRGTVGAVRDGRDTRAYQAAYTYLLLDEAEAVIAEQEHVYLWPCDCRSIVSKCRKPMFVCLRFENDRGLGWEISKERAVGILRSTDKAGLVHTDYLSDRPGDPHAVCNCCTDCCYPHLATERLGTGDVWPVRRHVAHIDMDLCKTCGRCGLRCPFEAIVCGAGGRPEFDAALCRGCGLCATGCSSDAIEMRPLAAG
jgi:Pyruvate/2-oxoacid:ferredoxin oxidoreductase delta subunit